MRAEEHEPVFDRANLKRAWTQVRADRSAPVDGACYVFAKSCQSVIGGVQMVAPQLREGTRFHHRLTLVGRDAQLDQLDEFAESEKARVFLLIGRGGLGKSRLLLEWSRRFQEKYPDQALRFVFNSRKECFSVPQGGNRAGEFPRSRVVLRSIRVGRGR